jgi:hypothetical protein
LGGKNLFNYNFTLLLKFTPENFPETTGGWDSANGKESRIVTFNRGGEKGPLPSF